VIVTAMMAWYDEDPAILYRAVTSAATIADRIIATDGRWDLYPGGRKASPTSQYAAIRMAAFDARLKLDMTSRFDVPTWTSQIHKRNHMLEQAQPTDWLMPLDADWELQGDRHKIRAELQATDADAITIPFHTPHNTEQPINTVASTEWHKAQAGTTTRLPLIYRNLLGIRIDNYHYHYTALKDGQRVSLWGDTTHPKANTHDLEADMVINHWCLHRDQRTIQANREYCDERAMHVAINGTEPA